MEAILAQHIKPQLLDSAQSGFRVNLADLVGSQ